MLPRIAVEGRLAADPELRFGPSGTAVARMRVVSADRRKNESTGQWEDSDTLWLDVTAFGKLAENLVESTQKGDLVVATGKLKTDEWQDRDSGQKRSKIVMIADTVAASLAFRVLPHAGATHQARAPQQVHGPTQQAYGQETDPPF